MKSFFPCRLSFDCAKLGTSPGAGERDDGGDDAAADDDEVAAAPFFSLNPNLATVCAESDNDSSVDETATRTHLASFPSNVLRIRGDRV